MVPNTNTILLTQIKINIENLWNYKQDARMVAKCYNIFVGTIQQKAKSQNRISNTLTALTYNRIELEIC